MDGTKLKVQELVMFVVIVEQGVQLVTMMLIHVIVVYQAIIKI